MTQHNALDPSAAKLLEEIVNGGASGALPREVGEALRAWIKANGEPVTRGDGTGGKELWLVEKGRPNHNARCTCGERDLDRLGRLHAARNLKWCCNESRHGADRRKVHRRTRARTIKVNEVNQRCAAIYKVPRNTRWLVRWRTDTSCSTRPEDDARSSAVKINGGNDAHISAPLRYAEAASASDDALITFWISASSTP
jgi:hypothetical protein